MFCPMLICKWQISDLIDPTGKDVAPEDNLVTQFSQLVEHLKNDHGAVIGGK